MTLLHEQNEYQTCVAIYCNTHLHESEMNTKSHMGQTLQEKYVCMIGYKFTPEKVINMTTYWKLGNITYEDICIHSY